MSHTNCSNCSSKKKPITEKIGSIVLVKCADCGVVLQVIEVN